MTPGEWWSKWLHDPAFRAEQEAQAYGAQYALYCRHRKDKNTRAKYLNAIANAFSGGLYKLTFAAADARAAILKRAGK
jgi:hypothetical protein